MTYSVLVQSELIKSFIRCGAGSAQLVSVTEWHCPVVLNLTIMGGKTLSVMSGSWSQRRKPTVRESHNALALL